MPLYQVTVERTIEAAVEVEAEDAFNAEVLAEQRADAGDYDDIWDDLAADANHSTFGVTELEP